jgi:hypothetical protein
LSESEAIEVHPFIETISVAGAIAAAIVGAIIVLSLFYLAVSWLSGGEKPDAIGVRGVLSKDTLVTVHVSGRKPFERVRFVGFTDSLSKKTHLPFELSGLVIFEDERKTRFLVRSKDIRMIVVPTEAGARGNEV